MKGAPNAKEAGSWSAQADPASDRGLGELAELLDRKVEDPLRRVPGRETFLWPPSDPHWVVKRFDGPMAGDRWYARIHEPDDRCPGQREYDNLTELSSLRMRVPRPIAWYRMGGRSLVVMEYVPSHRSVRDFIEDGGMEGRRWRKPWSGLLDIVLELHGANREGGHHHRDLYLQHFLLADPSGELCLIDLGRVRSGQRIRRRWLEKDLAALALSCPRELGPLLRLAWLDRYLIRLKGPLPRASRRRRLVRWSKGIEARRARMERHTPRFGEPLPESRS